MARGRGGQWGSTNHSAPINFPRIENHSRNSVPRKMCIFPARFYHVVCNTIAKNFNCHFLIFELFRECESGKNTGKDWIIESARRCIADDLTKLRSTIKGQLKCVKFGARPTWGEKSFGIRGIIPRKQVGRQRTPQI